MSLATENMTEVTKEEFYRAIGPLNVHPTIIDPYNYPYSSEWKTPMRHVVGFTEDYHPDGHLGITKTRYFLVDELLQK